MDRKKNITIYVYRDKIRQEVVGVTQRRARINAGDNATAGTVNEQADDGQAGVMLENWIDNYVQKAKARMEAYLHRVDHTGQDTDNERENVIAIHLLMPDTWIGSTDDLSRSIHSFVVNSCLSEWYEMVDATKADRYASKAAEDSDNIHWCVCKRIPGTNRKVYRPF